MKTTMGKPATSDVALIVFFFSLMVSTRVPSERRGFILKNRGGGGTSLQLVKLVFKGYNLILSQHELFVRSLR